MAGDYDFIALTEIGPKNLESRRCILSNIGYDLKYEEPTTTKGGAGLIHKESINLVDRNDLKLHSKQIAHHKLSIDNIWYETNLTYGTDNYIVGVIYRHPGSSVECIDDFTKQLESVMLKRNKEKKKCILTGDLNIDVLNINKNDHIKLFFNRTLQTEFIPTITLPTRIVDCSVTLIDHLFINRQVIKHYQDIITGNVYCGITDHLPIFVILSNKSKDCKTDRPLVRIYGEKNMAKFKDMISSTSWEELDETSDPDKALGIFYKSYNNAFFSFF